LFLLCKGIYELYQKSITVLLLNTNESFNNILKENLEVLFEKVDPELFQLFTRELFGTVKYTRVYKVIGGG